MLTQYGPFSRRVMEALKPELKLILRYGEMCIRDRYMIARARKGERAGLDMQDYARTSFPKPYEVAEKVCRDMEKRLGLPVAPEETGFLAIHIQRVMQQ